MSGYVYPVQASKRPCYPVREHFKFIALDWLKAITGRNVKFLTMKSVYEKIYRPRLIIYFDDRHLISVCSEIEIVIDNPVLTYDLHKV